MPSGEAIVRGVCRWRLPILVFGAILAHGSAIGLTDDEAYYWVLAQKPASGYAYHPPAVALCIAAAQAALGWLVGIHSEGLVRLPAALLAASLVAMGMRWFERVGDAVADGPSAPARIERGGLALAALAGIFALAWMMVPDWPLFAGWMIAFVATWEICFEPRVRSRAWFALGGGLTLAILSKYSGVLAAASSAAAIALWAPRERRVRAWACVASGVLAACVPILWWNSQHGWASILYQVSERHGSKQVSWARYARFWLIELALMGPALFVFLLGLARRAWLRRAPLGERFALAWLLPGAAVFCVQPLWSEFKPHWALIVWWPAALAMGLAAARGAIRPALWRAHVAYGFGMAALVWASCHYPVMPAVARVFGVEKMDPRLDVTNDLYGWKALREAVPEGVAVVGARYQTASQAAFALPDGERRVTLLPRDLKAMDEWPDLGVSDGQGPEWPRLTAPVIFVADNRYDSGPAYLGAECVKLPDLEYRRAGYPAKVVHAWRCDPRYIDP
jgi:4-amino-4-deoxy-L-arabinose transferase-like glycosyltransferase